MTRRPEDRRTRILLAKVGLDGHTRGIEVLMYAFREAGMEVVFPGLYQTPEKIARTAMQEDVDIVAVSNMTSAHRFYTAAVVEELRRQGLGDIPVVSGGIMTAEDASYLEGIGVTGNYGPGTPTDVIVNHIRATVQRRKHHAVEDGRR